MDKIREMLGWLLKHPISLAWILAIIAIVLNMSVSGKNEKHSVATSAPAATSQSIASGVTSNAVPVAQATSTDATSNQGAASAGIEQKEATTATSTPATAITAAQVGNVSQEITSTASEPETPAVESVATQPQVAEQPVAAQATSAAQPAVVANANNAATVETKQSNQPATSMELLRAAREAYWSGEFERAVDFYSQLVSQDPNPSHKGELANVFWKMQKPEQAADLYLEISGWLKEQGRMAEIINMKAYVDLVNPEKGKQLGALIQP